MKSSVLVWALTLGALAAAKGQTLPQEDDPNVFYGSLQFVRAVYAHALSTSDAHEAETIQVALRRELNLSEADYAILVREAAALGPAVPSRAFHDSKGSSAYGSVSSGSVPGPATPSFTAPVERVTPILQRLRAELSPSGWNSFRSFVNGPFRRSVTITRLSK